MNRISLLLKTSHPPRCPACMTVLTAGSIRFHYGVAVCGRCVDEWALSRTGEALLILANRVRNSQTSGPLGLRLFTPHLTPQNGLPLEAEIGNTYFFKPTYSPLGAQRP